MSFAAFLLRLLCLLLPWLPAAPARAESWTASVSEKDGLPVIAKGGAPAVTAYHGLWGANWSWAGLNPQFKITTPGNYSLGGSSSPLGLTLGARIRTLGSRQIVWDLDYGAAKGVANVIGGGIVFQFNLPVFGAEMGDPELLPDRRGWTWGRIGGNRIEFRFDSPLAAVYFERSQKQEIRSFFYNGSIPAGHLVHTATLSLSGDMATAPTVSERFGFADPALWPADILDWKTSPVDLAFLNQPEIPAGRHGFLRVAGDKLVFADGTPARFWGTNLVAYALYATAKDNVRPQARRLSQLGFNLVRIHHHDSPWVSPNIFGDPNAPDTRNLSAASFDRLDWWIKCLKDEGIHVWLDLHVQRQLKAGDRIDGFDEIVVKGRNYADPKGFSYVNASIRQAMKDFAQAYVSHRNPYTGLRYADDPAIVAMLVTNENDVTTHFGNSLLPDKNVPWHNAAYMARAASFAAAWGLPPAATWQSWTYGAAKLFLNDLEYRFNAEMIAQLRALGVKVPIATTSFWGNDPLVSLPALSSGNLIDVHAYGVVDDIGKNPLFSANHMHWIAAGQVAGKPVTVSEWNLEPFPVHDRHTQPLYLASAASLQGWDALMQYAYTQAALNSAGVPSNWHAYNDPALIATLPAAALLYRQGHVREATTTYVFAPTPVQLFNQPISPANSVALRTAAERGKLLVALPATRELPWLGKSPIPSGARIITDPKQAQLAINAVESVSDTGELRRNWEKGVFTVNTPRTQAAMGWIGGKDILLADVAISAATNNATVAVQSVDGKPIATSRQLMISFAARSLPAAPDRLPFYSEPVKGQVSIRAPSGLRLFRYSRLTGGEEALPVVYSGGRYSLALEESLQTYWLFLK